MFTPITRIILASFSVCCAALFWFTGNIPMMFGTLITAGLFIYGYFKSGTVYLAFQQLKKGNIDKAKELIDKVRYPDRLSKRQRSYYLFTMGIIALEKKELESSHSYLTCALDLDLRTNNDKSIVLLNLAQLELYRDNYDQAQIYLKKLATFDLKPEVEKEANRITKKIEKATQELNTPPFKS